MTKGEKIVIGIGAVVIILLALLLFVIFRRNTSAGDSEGWKKAYDAQEQTIKVLTDGRELLNEANAREDRKDSIYQKLILDLKPKYSANDKKLNDIPGAVRNLNREDLRGAATE